jgi:hypothetical protein
MTYAAWRDHPKPKYKKPHVSEGSAVLTSRQAAIDDSLSQEDRDRIRAEARKAASEALAAFEVRRGRR